MKHILALSLVLAPFACLALNPVVQTIYTADPAPVVHDGVCYLYTSHDEDVIVKNFFTMKDWRCFSSTDMVNWTDHGAVASLHDFKWAASGWGGGFENGAWAVQAIERDGKWFLYCPLQGRGIGVLVSTNGPCGPFTDPIGKPLIGGQYDSIDPTVFIDDDGQAYLCWGNPRCWYVKLNKDMISFDTSIGDKGFVVYDMTVEAFGKRSKEDPKRPTSYEEGPWLYQRNGLYYLFFAGGPISEHLGYSTGPSPIGPWKYGGVVLPTQGGSFTDHPGVVDYMGKTYLFYHNGDLPGGGGFHRSVCVDELKFNDDGSVVPMDMTKHGAAPAATLNPYQRVEAETIAWESGVETAKNDTVGIYVTDISNGDYIKVGNVDFTAKGAAKFMARIAGATEGGAIELRLDDPAGQLIGTLKVKTTSALDKWETQSCPVSGAEGVHDLVLRFTGGNGQLLNFDWWQFER
jgi:arabinoxylan arabinofuranohydrolase